MSQLTREQLYALAAQVGFSAMPYPGLSYSPQDEAVAIAEAESGGDTMHVHVNGSSTAVINGKSVQVPSGTRDRGVLQINDWWNNGMQPPNGGGGQLVTDTEAFDPVFSFQWTFHVTQGGLQTLFRAYFVTVQNGAYLTHLTPGQGGNPAPGPTPDPRIAIGQAFLDLVTSLKQKGLL